MNPKKSFNKSPAGQPNRRGAKNIGFAALLILFGLIIFAAYGQPNKLQQVPLSQVIKEANEGQYDKIVAKGDTLEITKDGEKEASLESRKDAQASLREEGVDYSKVEVVNEPPSSAGATWASVGINLLPVLIISLVLFFMLRSAQGQGNQALSFGKSRARLYGNEKDKIVFKDIAGSDEAKQDLQEVVEFLKYPKKFESVGAKIPKGVLLVGPPGTGKTMLARAAAGEANAPFFSISGSEFVEMFVGVGASRVRDLFAKAKKNAPCIIFIDEIDAVGRRRGSGMGGGR